MCLTVWPNSAETHFQLARCCRRSGDLDAAQAHLNRARELHWLREAVDLEYLLLAAQSGGVASVEKTLQTHLKNGHPEGPLILEAVVQGYLQVNRMQEAYQYASRWVTHYPDDWQAYFQRGMVLQRFAVTLTPLRLATQDYQRAVELNPARPEVRSRLAQILEFTGRYSEALPHFDLVRRARPDDVEALAGVVRCRFALGELREAAQLLDEGLARRPSHADLCHLKGRLCLETDEPEEAVRWLLRAKGDIEPRNPQYLHVLALACRRAGRSGEAEGYEASARLIDRDLQRVREITKEIADGPGEAADIKLRLEAVELLARQHQHEEATRWLLSALQIDPASPPARKALADLARQTANKQLLDLHRTILLADPSPIQPTR